MGPRSRARRRVLDRIWRVETSATSSKPRTDRGEDHMRMEQFATKTVTLGRFFVDRLSLIRLLRVAHRPSSLGSQSGSF